MKKVIPGVSWRHPLVRLWLRIMAPADWLVRKRRGLEHLPPYRVRARSTGVRDQFGGERFSKLGLRLAGMLKEHGGLGAGTRVLEIGCGCGRNAFAIAELSPCAHYLGVDIDRSSIAWCRESAYLTQRGFRFEFLDVQNDEYNPEGLFAASEYEFPFEDGTFDLIFLVSVFTHMLTPGVQNYVREIARLLAPGGTCVVSVLLVDDEEKRNRRAFPYRKSEHYYAHPTIPEIKVGYEEPFLRGLFEAEGLYAAPPIIGYWRRTKYGVEGEFDQDLLVYSKSDG